MVTLTTTTALLSARRLRVDADIIKMLPKSVQSVKNLDRLKERFGGIGYVTIRVRGAAPEALRRFARDVAPQLEALPTVRYVDYQRPVKFFRDRAYYFMELDDLKEIHRRIKKRVTWEKLRANPLYVDLEDSPRPKIELGDIRRKYEGRGSSATAGRGSSATAGRGKRQAARWRDGEAFYLDAKAQQLAILVKPTRLASDVAFARRVVSDVRGVLDRVDRAKYGPGLEINLAGRYTSRNRQQAGIQQDLRITTIVAVLLMLLYLGLHFRSASAVILVLLPLAVGLAWTFGAAAVMVPTLNMLTAFFGLILLGLGIDHGIHLLGRYQGLRADGVDGPEAVHRAFGNTGRAVIIASLTTMVAFIGLSFSDFRGFREFGRIAAVGTVLVVVAYTFLLPALLRLAYQVGLRLATPHRKTRSSRIAVRLASAAPAVFWLSLAALVGVAAQIPQARFNYNFAALNKRRSALKLEKRKEVSTDKIIGRSQTALVVLTDNDRDAATAAAALRKRRKALGARSGIDFLITSSDFVPPNQAQKRSVLLQTLKQLKQVTEADFSKKERKWLRELRDYERFPPFGAADLPVELVRRFRAYTPPGKKLAPGSFVLVFARVSLNDGANVRRLAKELRDIPISGGRKVSAAGEEMVLADVLDLVFRETPQVMALTMVLVFIALWLLVGSLSRALLCFIPPSVTVAATLGLLPVLDLRLNYLNVIMLPVLFGIAVDGGVHLVLAYTESGDLPQAYGQVGRSVAGAILTTAFGFGTLILSGHSGMQSLASLTVLGLGCALIATLLVLPALLALPGALRRLRLDPATSGVRLTGALEAVASLMGLGATPWLAALVAPACALPVAWGLGQLGQPAGLVTAIAIAAVGMLVSALARRHSDVDPLTSTALGIFAGALLALSMLPAWRIEVAVAVWGLYGPLVLVGQLAFRRHRAAGLIVPLVAGLLVGGLAAWVLPAALG
ncbi:MAG: efflux RND transporter permease subunit [bacterium]